MKFGFLTFAHLYIKGFMSYQLICIDTNKNGGVAKAIKEYF